MRAIRDVSRWPILPYTHPPTRTDAVRSRIAASPSASHNRVTVVVRRRREQRAVRGRRLVTSIRAIMLRVNETMAVTIARTNG
jgi:hypothetical protein